MKIFLLCLLAITALTGGRSAAAVTLDFETLADLDPVTTQLSGLSFANTTAFVAGAAGGSLNEIDFPPRSGVTVVSNDGAGAITITFDTPVTAVSGFFNYSVALTLTAFDALLAPVASATSAFGSNLADSGDPGSTPNERLEVAFAGGISSLTVQPELDGFGFTLDDFTFAPTAAVPEPAVSGALMLVMATLAVVLVVPRLRRVLPLASLGLVLLACPVSAAPTVGTLAGDLTDMNTGLPTLVKVTIPITDPTVLPTGVLLQRLNANGSVTTLGTMRDNGTNGDVVGGDRIFTLTHTFNESQAGTIRLRASAAFRGVLRRVLSAPIIITVRQDKCPLTPPGIAPNADGCAKTVVIPNVAAAYCNQLGAACNLTPQTGGTCSECRIERADGVSADCFKDGSCEIDASGKLIVVAGGSLQGAGALLRCKDSTCTAAADTGPVSCSSTAADGCSLERPGQAPTACVDDLPCEKVIDSGLFQNPFAGEAIVRVQKIAIGGDDTFAFFIPELTPPLIPSLTTSGGVGALRLFVATEATRSLPVSIAEELPEGWTLVGIDCPNGGQVDLQARRVTFELRPNDFFRCTFTNRLPGDDEVTVPNMVGFAQSNVPATLTGAGLTVGTKTEQVTARQTAEAGFVVAQSPPAGTKVAAGTAVDFTLAVTQLSIPGVGTVLCKDAPCFQNPDGSVKSIEGTLEIPGLRTTCLSGAGDVGTGCSITLKVVAATGEGGVTCTGGPSACQTTVGTVPVASCPPDRGCTVIVDRDLAADPTIPRVALRIQKVTIGGDAAFTFAGDRFAEGSRSLGTITTAGGVGTSTITWILKAGVLHRIRELKLPGWVVEAATCSVPGAVDGGADFVEIAITPAADAVCTFTNRKLPAGQNRATPTTGNEAPIVAGSFGLPPGNRITIAGSNGFYVVDAITDQIPTAGTTLLSFFGPTFANLFGALVVPSPVGDGSDAVFFHGSQGASARRFFPAQGIFGATEVAAFGSVTDAVHFGGDHAAQAVLWVNQNSIKAHVWQNIGGQIFFTQSGSLLSPSGSNLPQVSGPFISAFTYDLDFDANGLLLPTSTGRIMALTNGQPGQVWIVNPASPFFPAPTKIGDVGNSPRRIRCLPSHNLCAVSNFASDSLTIVTWDGQAAAAIVGTVSVGDGPVGIGLVADGANVKIISTGFNSNTFTVTTLGPAGNVLSNVTSPAPAGCTNPGHAIWLPGVAGTAVLTCKGSNSYAVVVP